MLENHGAAALQTLAAIEGAHDVPLVALCEASTLAESLKQKAEGIPSPFREWSTRSIGILMHTDAY